MPFSGVQTCALDRKSTRLNSSHTIISYAVFCLKKKKNNNPDTRQPPPLHERPLHPARPCGVTPLAEDSVVPPDAVAAIRMDDFGLFFLKTTHPPAAPPPPPRMFLPL